MAGPVAQETKAVTKVGENPARLPKRFYKLAAVAEEGGRFELRLDGKPAKTRGGRAFALSTAMLAAAIAEEWNAQGDAINFAAMPMTRFAMTAIDLAADAGGWRDTIVSYLKSDLVCYRASGPSALVERQRAAFDPLLEWAANSCGLILLAGEGVSFIPQPEGLIAAGEKALAGFSGDQLLGVKAAAESSGSAVIALALARRVFAADALFRASRVDEDFQAGRWGEDAEARARAERLKTDFHNAARFLSLL